VDPVSPDGRIVRVHLRPFVARQGDRPRLLADFVQTASMFKGSRPALEAAWAQVVQLAAAKELPFAAEAAHEFGAKMAAQGYPAVRHSPAYRDSYRPAYRVLARAYLPGLVPE
jgi:hypothetical protein